MPIKVGQLVEMKLEEDRIILKPDAEDPSVKLDSKDIAGYAEEAIVKEALRNRSIVPRSRTIVNSRGA